MMNNNILNAEKVLYKSIEAGIKICTIYDIDEENREMVQSFALKITEEIKDKMRFVMESDDLIETMDYLIDISKEVDSMLDECGNIMQKGYGDLGDKLELSEIRELIYKRMKAEAFYQIVYGCNKILYAA